MSKEVLVVEDAPEKRELWDFYLRDAGFIPVIPAAASMTELADLVTQKLDNEKVHATILDMDLQLIKRGTRWGGINLYIALKNRGLVEKCGHVIIGSRVIDARLRDMSDISEYYPLKVFVDLVGISYEHVLRIDVNSGFSRVIQAIKDADAG